MFFGIWVEQTTHLVFNNSRQAQLPLKLCDKPSAPAFAVIIWFAATINSPIMVAPFATNKSTYATPTFPTF